MPNLPVVAKAPKKVKKVSMNFPSMVKQEVAKQISKKTENKLIMENGIANTPVGTDYVEYVTPRVDIIRPLLPKLDVGTELFNRVGGVIEPKALKLRGTVFFDWTTLPVVVSSRDCSLRLMILTHKSQRSMPELVANPSAVYTNTLMWNGQAGDSVAYQGCVPYYNQLPVNRKSWNVIEDRIIHLRKGLGNLTSGGAGETFMSPTRSHNFEIVLTAKDLPASLKYDGGLGTIYPTNFAPVFCFGWVDNSDNIPIGTTDHDKVIRIEYQTSLIYEDS